MEGKAQDPIVAASLVFLTCVWPLITCLCLSGPSLDGLRVTASRLEAPGAA